MQLCLHLIPSQKKKRGYGRNKRIKIKKWGKKGGKGSECRKQKMFTTIFQGFSNDLDSVYIYMYICTYIYIHI